MELPRQPRMARSSWALIFLTLLCFLFGVSLALLSSWQQPWALGLVAISFGLLNRIVGSTGYQFASILLALAAGLSWGQYQGPWLAVLLGSALLSLVLFSQRKLRTEALYIPESQAAKPGDVIYCQEGLGVVIDSEAEKLSLTMLFGDDQRLIITPESDAQAVLAAVDKRSRRRVINRLPFAYLLTAGPLLNIAGQIILGLLSSAGLALVLIYLFSALSPSQALVMSLPLALGMSGFRIAVIIAQAYQISWDSFASVGLMANGSVDQIRLAEIKSSIQEDLAAVTK